MIGRHGMFRAYLAPDSRGTGNILDHGESHRQAQYVCPMHPGVIEQSPGGCQVCGMDLVKRDPETGTGKTADRLPGVLVPPEFIHNFGVRLR